MAAPRSTSLPHPTLLHLNLQSAPSALPQHGSRLLVVYWDGPRAIGQQLFDPVPPDATSTADLIDGAATLGAPVSRPVAASDTVGVSVVICTRDRTTELARCVESLRHQTQQPKEIIIVDNASRDDGARHVAAAAGAIYVREERPGLDIARNAGASRAQGEIVAYTDDDVELHPLWVEALASAFDADDIMAVTGLVLPAEIETEAQWIFESQWGFGRGFRRIDFDADLFRAGLRSGFPAWEIGAGASMAFRRQAFALVGGFDERLDVGAAGCSGDSEFWYRLLAAGWRCRYEPSAIAFHFHRRNLEGLRKQIRAYMCGHVTALLVQYERTGHAGNLRRAFVTLPVHYARQCVGRLRHGVSERNCLLQDEIRGYLAGFRYYAGSGRRRPASLPCR